MSFDNKIESPSYLQRDGFLQNNKLVYSPRAGRSEISDGIGPLSALLLKISFRREVDEILGDKVPEKMLFSRYKDVSLSLFSKRNPGTVPVSSLPPKRSQ